MKNHVIFGIFALFASLGMAFAQTSSGTISGQVEDPSGLAVAGARVVLTNELTGDTRSATSDTAGQFVFTSVQPGRFTITAEAEGFKQVKKTGIELTASDRLSAGTLQLQVGTVSESVSVQAESTPVQTTSQERSGLIEAKQVEGLLSVGRDFMSLLRTIPGVVGDEGGSSLGTSGTPTINGVRSEYNQATVDGVTGNTRGLNTLDTPLNLDAIAEIKVLTANYQAEYGKGAGSIINIVSKSGTQQFHGTAYYYIRNEAFNANSFFNNLNGQPRARYRYDTIGGNVGGPIYWPGKFNSNKNKLFFFYSQEYLPNNRPDGLKYYTVPTQLERQGNFSQGPKVIDPSTGQPFLGNVISSSRINPSMQNLLNIFPLPNFTNTAISRGNYNYVTNTTAQTPVSQQVLRVDYNITDKWRMFFRGMNMSVDNNGFNSPANKTQSLVPIDYKTHNPNVVADLVWTASPTVVNELTLGTAFWTEDQGIAPSDLAKLEKSKIGYNLSQFYPQNNPLGVVPAASFGGITNAASIGFDGRFPMHDVVTSISLTDGLTKVWRSHLFKVGVDLQGDQYLQAHSSGGGVFSGSFDFQNNANNPGNTGYAYANALLGNFYQYSEPNARLDYKPRTKAIEWYAQDQWRVTRKLTLDYGVRFTYAVPQTLKVGSNFVPGLFNPANAPLLYQPAKVNGKNVAVNPLTGEALPQVYIGLFIPGTGNLANGTISTGTSGYPSGLVYGNGVLAAPRLGFAYDPFGDGKTAIRGGFGIFYNARARSGQEGDLTFNPPSLSVPQQYYGNAATFLDAGTVLAPSSVGHGIELHPKMLASYNVSLGIQRKLGLGAVVDVAYVGTLGRHLSDFRQINNVPYGSHFLPQYQSPIGGVLPDNFFRPYPGYANIPMQYFDLTSSYHSLQSQITRRFSHGLQFGAVWTWSSAMDYTDTYNGTVATYNNIRTWNYGKAGFDRTHIVNLTWLWDIPQASKLWNNGVSRWALDNWQVSGLASFVSGAPLYWNNTTTAGNSNSSFGTGNLTNGVDLSGGGDGWRPVVIGNAANAPRNFYQWFNSSAFGLPAPGTAGNAGPLVARGPGINNWDISLFKNFVVREKVRLQIRVESYNTFNHTQFDAVYTQVKFDPTGKQVNGQFGQVVTARDPRILQFAARISF